MKKNILKFFATHNGLTLIEILVAIVLFVSVVASLTLFAPRAVKAIAKVHSRSAAASLASSKIDDIKSHPYALIPATPDGGYFSVNSTTGPCDCSNVDFTQGVLGGGLFTSSETITVGQIAYTRQTCINYLQNAAGLGWQSNCKQDTALKQIVTNVSWMLGSEPQSFSLRSLASPPAQYQKMSTITSGNVLVNVCPANKQPPTSASFGCDALNLALVNGAEVSMSNGAFTAENNHAVPPNPVGLTVPPGSGYTLHVQVPNYFPFYQYNITVPPTGILTLPVIMRDLATYGSTLVGEISIADHPVISKVIAQVADADTSSGCTVPAGTQCQDQTEELEIYNPTQNPFTFGAGGNARLVFCNSTVCVTYTLSEAQFAKNTTYALAPGSYLLLTGQDIADAAPNPGGVAPDISYNVASFPPEGLIPYKTGGGVQLQVLIGATWTTVNEIHWLGQNGTGPAAGPGPWNGTALPKGIVQPVICTGGSGACTSCTGWSNVGCGSGGCPSSQMQQTRTCSPAGCSNSSQCVNDPSCSPLCYACNTAQSPTSCSTNSVQPNPDGTCPAGYSPNQPASCTTCWSCVAEPDWADQAWACRGINGCSHTYVDINIDGICAACPAPPSCWSCVGFSAWQYSGTTVVAQNLTWANETSACNYAQAQATNPTICPHTSLPFCGYYIGNSGTNFGNCVRCDPVCVTSGACSN